MTTEQKLGVPQRLSQAQSSVEFCEHEARTILLVRALEEEPSQTHIARDKFEEATRVYAQSMPDPTKAHFSETWGWSFLKPRSESLYRMAVAEHQVYRHFVDPHPASARFVWVGAVAAALLTATADRWMYHDQINVVSLTLLVVLIITLIGVGLVVCGEIAWGRAKPADGIWSKSASWLTRVLHRIPGARPVSPLVVTRFQDLWLQVAERLFIARLQLAMQFIGLGVAVGAAVGLIIGGAVKSVPVHWGSTWFEGKSLYLTFRTITVPGHLAHAVLGKEPMTFDEFLLLRQEEGGAKVLAPEELGSQTARPSNDGRAPAISRQDELKSKWLSLVIWSLAVGALLPRLLAAGYLWRKIRKLRSKVLLDLSEPYYKGLRRQTTAHQRQLKTEPLLWQPQRIGRVWWKPSTWFQKTRI